MGKSNAKKTITIVLNETDRTVINSYKALLLDKFGVQMTDANVARALLNRAAEIDLKKVGGGLS
jgi:tRNA A37 threonylcarbamoyladenosine synthetase subunit TsaC/SUA5/YrdC